MKTEPNANRCPKCQAPLPPNAPQGLCPKCLLAAAATPTETGPGAGKNPPPPIQTVAAAFPHLEIQELVGQGGMGVVYKARQPKLDRFVALKLLPQSLAADPAFAERFNREARVLARLDHPNIVTVHDFGQSGGLFYLLMEFVDGVNLRQAMQAGRFTPQQAMLLVPKICEALQFAHDEGILHRDIKPENILLDTRGRVKIADFGIARLLGEAKEQATLTASGIAVGTPNYMAPEQLEHPHDVDQRADIYSLGVVFYEMLTGELPIGRFAPPSTKSAVDRRVDDIVFRALEKEREKRFRSATEVKTSVEAVTSTAAPPQDPQMETATSPAPSDSQFRAPCYFNTPQRMRNCFPSAAARVFTCKGELVLDSDALTFISPWRTTIRMPLKDIQDLSIGQFQMWTTPWVMKYARLNFLSASFSHDGRSQTVHLTPVPLESSGSTRINDYVGRWFECVQQAIRNSTGRTPPASDPRSLMVSAEPAWNRKGLPLTFGFMITWLAAWLLLKPRLSPLTWTSLLVVSLLLLMFSLWFAVGFLRANHALWRGELDKVTSDEPPAPEPTVPRPTGLSSSGRLRSRFLNPSVLGVVALAILAPLVLLLWGFFPSFGNTWFGNHSPATASQCVIDTVSTEFGSSALLEARRKLKELRGLRYTGENPAVRQQLDIVKRLEQTAGQARGGAQPAPEAGKWRFKCLVPPDQLARVLFIRWSDGVPAIQPGLSAYFKTGHASAMIDFIIDCDPQTAPTNTVTAQVGQRTPDLPKTILLMWDVYLGLGYTAANQIPAAPFYHLLDMPYRMTVRSGHQRVIRLLDYPQQGEGVKGIQDGVELRVILEPLKSPVVLALPSEKQIENFIAGSGIDLPTEEMLKLIKRLPTDR